MYPANCVPTLYAYVFFWSLYKGQVSLASQDWLCFKRNESLTFRVAELNFIRTQSMLKYYSTPYCQSDWSSNHLRVSAVRIFSV